MQGARHVVGVIGGATAGAETAGRLAELGVEVVVFEQNARPYGKIEDGLPRWHAALRRKEYETIAEKLATPGVHFVPRTRIGRDVDFADLAQGWGLSAVVLACGAWRDRPLPVEGADAFVGRGLVYQNPFIIWFNHAEEAAYHGPRFEALDRALVVGGGLASIDVVKVLMLETTRARLAERGIDVPMIELEVKGIPKILASRGLRFEELGLEGCMLFYRRRVEDMPLVELPEDASPERLEKVRKARGRVLEKAMEKYLFRFEACAAPDALIVEDGRLAGLRFRRTRIEGSRVVPTDETFERRGSCVISSIGSIPEPIPGIETKGELFAFTDWDTGRLAAYPIVFGVGNVVTGKGNIVASRKHAAQVTQEAIEAFLGLRDGHAGEEAVLDPTRAEARERAEAVADRLEARPPLPPERVAALLERVHARQREVGYGGDLRAWLEKVTPADLQ
jgi:NADPH-dependent glutamate synthase beta subunit-like oxidoreductase